MVNACGQAPAVIKSVDVIAGVASQLSVDVALPVFAGAVLAVHNMVTSGGHEITGPRLSSMKMV